MSASILPFVAYLIAEAVRRAARRWPLGLASSSNREIIDAVLSRTGWHDLFALTKRGVASMEGDFRPLLQNLQFFKDLLALPRRLPEGT